MHNEGSALSEALAFLKLFQEKVFLFEEAKPVNFIQPLHLQCLLISRCVNL